MAGGEERISDVQVALRGDTGIGKSHIIRELLADAIRAIRKAGNDRPAVIFIPRIDLAQEAAERMRAIACGMHDGGCRRRGRCRFPVR